jgi:catechol 2,3-dioxygenase-like lactoylglutathione lyase family enzyme
MQPIMFMLWLMFSPVPATPGASLPAAPTPAQTSAGAFFALSVADARASARWYSEKLGLAVVMEGPKHDKVAVIVLEGAGLIVELIQNDDAVPLTTAAPAVKDRMLVHGMVKAGAIVSDFDGMLAKFKERSVPIAFGPYPAREGQRANVIIRDNAGNLIQFFGR